MNSNYLSTKTKRSVCLLFVTLFTALSFSSRLSAADYYWVNGHGNWSEFATHWATESGGSVFHMVVPGPDDNVFFDGNSFPLPLIGQMVTIGFL